MRNRRLLPLLLLALASAAPAAAEEAIEVGRVRLPRDIKYSGDVHEKGPYGLRIVPGEQGPWFVLLDAAGDEVLRELAIVQERRGQVRRAQLSVHVLTRDEHMVRLIVRQGTKRYLAYFETT